MELAEVMRTTAAVRQFTDEAVPDEVLFRVLDLARHAPSGGNRQAWGVIVVRDRELRRALRDLAQGAWREYVAHLEAGLVPFAPLPERGWQAGPGVDLAAARRVERPAPFVDELDRVPVLLAVTADLGSLAVMDTGLDRQSIVGGASVYPFVENLLLAARDQGLGGVMTTFLCREERAVRDLLVLPDGVVLAAVVALGRPVKQVRRLRREPVEAFTWVDRHGGEPFARPSSGP